MENALRSAEGKEQFDYAKSRARFIAGNVEWQKRAVYGYVLLENDEEFALQHATYEQIVSWKLLEESQLNDPLLQIVVAVRNPFSRMVSEYKWKCLFGFDGTFAQMLHMAAAEQWHKERIFYQHFLPQADFVRGIDFDKENVHVIYFEHLNEASDAVFAALAETYPQLANVSLAQENVGANRKKHWKEYYDDKTLRDIVVEMYREDFDTFGYSTEIDGL